MSDLSAQQIQLALRTRRLGRPCLFFPQTGSTNDVADAYARDGAAEGLVVVTDEQTTGRGRLDRRWWAPPGSGLLMSLLLRPPIPLREAGRLTMCLGLGAVEGIEAVTGVRPALKWPNDLLLDGRKLGGMLTELRPEGDRIAYAVLGLGLNANLSRRDDTLPADLLGEIASLSDALGHAVDRAELLAAILLRCEVWYDGLLAAPLDTVLPDAWAQRLDTLGRTVTVATPQGVLHGRAVGVTPEGALRLEDAEGRAQIVWSGDVTAVRAG